ncbi:hypothetical protein PPERSA_02635 [Pseudocohnilembus persalinus]|uniref:Uncharacterized protein n=1 Tax=Pseudocohnilembus persalinus TaxID=266149 RepID=A0A0V0R5K0_PSEPJ|nr:hypothetical protein PPERSA_02635 [Pseudocohnilembus persalinus]|eukprot:KRX09763.1 hypothetical protein PPERSA_02635 [Pseudocohnilembus persalinus]
MNNQIETMSCPIKEHDEQPYIFFKFSEQKNEILQCMFCNLEDPQVNKKIAINQLLNQPIWKIKNFPPLKDQKEDVKIKKILENCTKEEIKKFKEKILSDIDLYYKKIANDLLNGIAQSKKYSKEQFEKYFQFVEIDEIYNIEPLKNSLKQFQQNQINLDQLFNIQLNLKKDFEQEQKPKIVNNQEKIRQEINNQFNSLKQQLNQKVNQFNQQITLNNNIIQQQIINIQQPAQNNNNNNNNNHNINQNINPNNNKNIQQYPMNFYKSQDQCNSQNEIQITNNSRKIEFDNKSSKAKKIYSQSLDKEKTYHLKIKIDLQGSKKSYLDFRLISSEEKDSDWFGYNYLFINDSQGNCGSNNYQNLTKQGIKFSEFMEDNKTVFNVVFNYQDKLFEVYDDEKKAQLIQIIDWQKTKQDFVFGIQFCQNYNQPYPKCRLEIIDIQCY